MTRAKGRREMADSTAKDTDDRGFYSVFDGTKGRPESTYLDMEERKHAEVLRAKAEGREPNFDEGSLPPAVGTVLVIKEQRVDNSYYANPPVAYGHVEAKEVDPVQTLPVSTGQADVDVDLGRAAQVARERQSENSALLGGKDESAPVTDASVKSDSDAVSLKRRK